MAPGLTKRTELLRECAEVIAAPGLLDELVAQISAGLATYQVRTGACRLGAEGIRGEGMTQRPSWPLACSRRPLPGPAPLAAFHAALPLLPAPAALAPSPPAYRRRVRVCHIWAYPAA
jgi:hypothetical protein